MIELYESQRAMRNMRKAAMQRGVVAVLDVGTSKIACLVLRFDGTERLSEADGIGAMAGQAGFRVIGAATTRSRGVRFGEVSAMAETRARDPHRRAGGAENGQYPGSITSSPVFPGPSRALTGWRGRSNWRAIPSANRISAGC